jgi:hypothetical protein
MSVRQKPFMSQYLHWNNCLCALQEQEMRMEAG